MIAPRVEFSYEENHPAEVALLLRKGDAWILDFRFWIRICFVSFVVFVVADLRIGTIGEQK